MVYFDLTYFMFGIVAGLLSGLIGIGGGIVIVPGFLLLFNMQHLTTKPMHFAVGSSFATMLFTTSRSLISHLRRGVKVISEYRYMLPGLVAGVVAGAYLVHFIHTLILGWCFIIFLLFASLRLFFADYVNFSFSVRGKKLFFFVSFFIGFFSSLLGISGSPMTIPFLEAVGVDLRRAIVVSVACGLAIAIMGTISYAVMGSYLVVLPHWSTGYIYWPAVLSAALGSVIFAPVGAYLSNKLPVNVLRKVFAIFLVVVAIHMMHHY
jgi:uncharacterized protein